MLAAVCFLGFIASFTAAWGEARPKSTDTEVHSMSTGELAAERRRVALVSFYAMLVVLFFFGFLGFLIYAYTSTH